MNTSVRKPLLGALVALIVTLSLGLRAEDNVPSTSPAAAAPPPAPVVAEAPAEPSVPPAEEPKLRRLDEPTTAVVEEPATPAQDAAKAEKSEEAPADSRAEKGSSESDDDDSHSHRGRHSRHGDNARVSIWQNSTLAAGESADAVVSIIGSSTSAGDVGDAVVSILGSSTSSGKTSGPVVSIIGNSRATAGSVGDVVISVLGNTYVNAKVNGEVVAVLGNVELGPDAVVGGNLVCVGGTVTRAPGSVVNGQVNHIAVGGMFANFEGLHAWFEHCLMYARPLAFAPHLMWAWWIAIGFLLFYLVIAAVFPATVERCQQTFVERPGYSIISALLVMILSPILFVPLLFTVVGAPALVLFLLVAGILGKVVMLAWIGSGLTRLLVSGARSRPALNVLVGGIVVMGLYTVPIVGFLTAKVLSWVGIGVVVYTINLGMKRNRRVVAATATAATPPPPPIIPTGPLPTESAGFTGAAATGTAVPPPASAEAASANVPPFIRPPTAVPISAATLHRAGFWIRLAASALDAMLVAIAIHLMPKFLQPNFLLVYAAYCVILWGLKGTTVGGIVCNLKVVRLDDRPVDWATALVRSLAGFLSLFAAGIGFIWVSFDDQRQSWHDKIAGTTIVQVPKGVPLV